MMKKLQLSLIIILISSMFFGVVLASNMEDDFYGDYYSPEFGNVNLSGKNYHGSRQYANSVLLWHSNISNADFGQAILTNALMCFADAHGANFYQATLSGARCWYANFSYAQMSMSKLCYASLENASFYHAQLMGADLTGAAMNNVNITAADLRGACLKGTTGITVDQLLKAGVVMDHATVLPDGMYFH